MADQLHTGRTTTDIVASVGKGIAGVAPIVGPMIGEIVGNIVPNQRIDRIAQFVELLNARVEKLEAETLQAKIVMPDIVDMLEDAFTQAARATSPERLEYIANVVANGISAEGLNQAENKRMLWLLGQLNDAEIIILRSKLVLTREDAEKDAGFREKHGGLIAPNTTHMGSSIEDFEAAALKDSYHGHLHDLGLLRPRFKKPRRGELPEFDEKTGMMKASGSDITRLGKMLLGYLDLMPSWCER